MRLREVAEFEASPEALFALTQDYDRRLSWDPFLSRATLLDGATRAGIGVRARCVNRIGFGMVTRYITFRPPTACAVEMTRGPMLLRSFAGSWRFEAIADGRARVIFTYDLVARPALLTGLVARIFRRNTRRRLEALGRAAAATGG